MAGGIRPNPNVTKSKDLHENFKETLNRERMRRFLSRLVDQISVDEFKALPFKEVIGGQAFHILPRELPPRQILSRGIEWK